MTRSMPPRRSTIILKTIHLHRDAGVVEVGRKLKTTSARTWIILDDLERAGLIKYSNVGRAVRLSLTAKGTKALKETIL